MIYHAVMIDETGCEFPAQVEAENYNQAMAILREEYPESRCDQLETPDQALERERLMLRRIQEEEEGDFRQWDYEQEWGH